MAFIKHEVEEVPKRSDTLKDIAYNRQTQWRHFKTFCDSNNYIIDGTTPICELAFILETWSMTMKRTDGSDYKESVFRTIWNNTATTLQEMFLKNYHMRFDPFEDIDFLDARNARDSKCRQLKRIAEKRKLARIANADERGKKSSKPSPKQWDENTPDGLQKKFYISAVEELGWQYYEAAVSKVYHFKVDGSDRIEYNSTFTKTSQESNGKSRWLVPHPNVDVCVVRLYLKLMEKRPQYVTSDRLFLLPNPNWRLMNCWFKNTPIGINHLALWAKETATLSEPTKEAAGSPPEPRFAATDLQLVRLRSDDLSPAYLNMPQTCFGDFRNVIGADPIAGPSREPNIAIVSNTTIKEDIKEKKIKLTRNNAYVSNFEGGQNGNILYSGKISNSDCSGSYFITSANSSQDGQTNYQRVFEDTTDDKERPIRIYQNCIFNVQNMYCNCLNK